MAELLKHLGRAFLDDERIQMKYAPFEDIELTADTLKRLARSFEKDSSDFNRKFAEKNFW